jgi:hypothetical protein
VKPAHGMRRRNRRTIPGVILSGPDASDQFHLQSVRIAECEGFFGEALADFLDGDSSFGQPLFPEFDGLLRNAERCDRDLARADSATRSSRPWKEREDRARRADGVCETKVIGPGSSKFTVRLTRRNPRTCV